MEILQQQQKIQLNQKITSSFNHKILKNCYYFYYLYIRKLLILYLDIRKKIVEKTTVKEKENETM